MTNLNLLIPIICYGMALLCGLPVPYMIWTDGLPFNSSKGWIIFAWLCMFACIVYNVVSTSFELTENFTSIQHKKRHNAKNVKNV